jgi:cobalt/nickel transport system ATP-binding protein
LLLHLNGYLTPSAGLVRIGDFKLTDDTVQEIRRTVGMVFQDPDDQLFMSTVFDDVAFGPLNLGHTADEVSSLVESALATVGMEHLKDRPPHRLSAGQKRRVAIASVLSMTPDILVMDEPSAGLDPRARRQLIDLLRSFRHTKIIATHDLDMVFDICERTIVMHDGQVQADGPTPAIFEDAELLESCCLEKPLRMQGCPICSKP